MPEYVTAYGGLLALLVIIMVVHNLSRARSAGAYPAGPAAAPRDEADGGTPAPEIALPPQLPRALRLRAWWRRWFLSRDAVDGEWLLDADPPSTYRVTLPVPRRVVRLDLLFAAPRRLPLADVAITPAEGETAPPWAGRWGREGGRARLRLELDGGVPVRAVTVTLRDGGGFDCDTELLVVSRAEPDADALIAARHARRQRSVPEFLRHLEAYEKHCDTNPVVAMHLAKLHGLYERPELAEIHALRALGLGRPDPAVGLLRELFTRRDWRLADERLATLREKAAAWDLPGHHGLVALATDRDFLSGPGFRRERYHAAVLVRRRAAARKYRHVTVPMVAAAGGLIDTAACIRRADGRLEHLADDRFTVGSAEDDNPFIAVARRQTGIWILPDLVPGDVVEYTWETVRLGRHDGPRHSRFVLANVADPETPTLRARLAFTAPPAWDTAFAVRNTGPGRETAEAANGWPTTIFGRERILPRRSHSHQFQDELLNPIVACAPAEASWDEVARDLLASSCAAARAPLPPPLAGLCASGGTTREILARAFYWIRDHIKYASVASANRDLDHPERAARVVAAGMGDCKDVSLLLAMVCRELGVPWEFVLMSTGHGIVLEELPADQFDHMLVRARPDGEWLYLDAAGAHGVFCAPPAPAQGLTALAGRETGALVTIPESAPGTTRVVVDEVYDRVEDGWLAGRMELHMHGHPARALDEAWKHLSLVAVDPERAADDAMHHVLPECQAQAVDRLRDTAGSDELHVVARGRRAPLVPLDGHRIAAMAVLPAGMPQLGGRQPQLREPFQFPLAMEFEWRVSFTGEVGRLVRAVSRVPDLATASCTVTDERAAGPAAVVRRLRIVRRTVDGDELAALPGALGALEEACRLVVSLADDPG